MTDSRPAARVADDLRVVAEALVSLDPDDPMFSVLAESAATMRDHVDRNRPDLGAPAPRERSFADSAVFSGSLNLTAPPVRLERVSEAPPVLVGRVRLGARFEGPVGHVHGGVLAGIMDELLGATVAALGPGRGGYTGTLKMRYRRPTPLHTDLEFKGVIHTDRGRMVKAFATCTVDGGVSVEAEGLFVRPPPTAGTRSNAARS